MDLAKEPTDPETKQRISLNKETIQWLEDFLISNNPPPVMTNTPTNLPYNHAEQTPAVAIVTTQDNEKQTNMTNFNKEHDPKPTPSKNEFVKDRNELRKSIAQRNEQGILSEEYIKSINTGKLLGSGGFGTVYSGFDTELQKEFVIKTIDAHILIYATDERIHTIKKSFLREQKVLANFHHPNIARLLAYSCPTNLRGNYYLIYEYADRRSLDTFWKHDTSREQLSLKRRIIIAYEILTALQFLHKGNDEFQACFHRDLKSANVVLTEKLSAQLIDCGLAKFVTDGDTQTSCTGRVGTTGYVCPEFDKRGSGFEARCDIFSFGVILTELITGRLQNSMFNGINCFNFETEYIEEENPRNLDDDFDHTLHVGRDASERPKFVGDFSKLALDCMASRIKNRPTGDEVMTRLASILKACTNKNQKPHNGNHSVSASTSCCQRYQTNANYPDKDTCHQCCTIDEAKAEIMMHVTNECNGINTNLVTVGKEITNHLDLMFTSILPVLQGLDTRFNNKIPRHFVLIPATPKSFQINPLMWLQCILPRRIFKNNPTSWFRSKFQKKYYLYFVCAHSFKPINPPIIIHETKEWVKTVAPALAVSLRMLSIALKLLTSITIDVSDKTDNLYQIGTKELSEMIGELGEYLDAKLKKTLDEEKLDAAAKVLNNDAYDYICEKANEQNEWRKGMTPVCKPNSPVTLWVANEIAMDSNLGYKTTDFLT